MSYQKDAVVSFPLYSEALKFAYHGEKMIQTAIRALTLNIYNGIVLRSVVSLSNIEDVTVLLSLKFKIGNLAT